MNKKFLKRTLSLMLSLMMIVGALPLAASAAGDKKVVSVSNLSNSEVEAVDFESLAAGLEYINKSADGSQWGVRMITETMDAVANVTLKEEVSFYRYNRISSSYVVDPGSRINVSANCEIDLLEGSIYVANDVDKNSKLIVNGKELSSELKPVMCYVDAKGHAVTAANFNDLKSAVEKHNEECSQVIYIKNASNSAIRPIHYETLAGGLAYINRFETGSQWQVKMMYDTMDAVNNFTFNSEVAFYRYNKVGLSYIAFPGTRANISETGDLELLEGIICVSNKEDGISKLVINGKEVDFDGTEVLAYTDKRDHVFTAKDITELNAIIEKHTKECTQSAVIRNRSNSTIEPIYFATVSGALAYINKSPSGDQWELELLADNVDAVNDIKFTNEIAFYRHNATHDSYVVYPGARANITAAGDINLLEGTVCVNSTKENVAKLFINGKDIAFDGDTVFAYADAFGHVLTAADFTALNEAIEKHEKECDGEIVDTDGVIDETKFNADVIKLFNTKAVFLNGYDNGKSIKPNNKMTRAEAAQMFYNMLNDKNIKITASFTDVPANAWYADAVNTLATLGIMNGTAADKFEPLRNINRAEFTTLVMRFAKEIKTEKCSFGDVQKGEWYYDAIAAVEQLGWIDGYDNKTSFRPKNPITRAEVATIVNRMFNRNTEKEYVENNYATPKFDDITAKHWAYQQIIVATSTKTAKAA